MITSQNHYSSIEKIMKDVIINKSTKWGEKMNRLKSTKYMNVFTNFGYAIGFGLILYYSIFARDQYILPIAGVIVIFGARLIGYAIDRTIEYLDERKK